jgi:hypothetical protein
MFQFLTSVLSEAQRQSITSVCTFDTRFDMDDPNERYTVDRIDSRACTFLRILGRFKTLRRIMIYEGGWYNQQEFEESFLRLIYEELAKVRDGAIGIKVDL